MKKVTVSLPQGKWGGLKTKYPKDSDQVKFNDFTGTSKNFENDVAGAITKRKGGIDFAASGADEGFEAVFSSGTRHMLTMTGGTLKYTAGSTTLSTVTSGYSASGSMEFAQYMDRVYFDNGIDSAQVYDDTATYGGVTYSVPRTKVMGCQVPTAPSAALVTTGTGNVPAGAHTYKVTYLYYGSEESNGSSASGAVTADGTHMQVTVTIPVGGYGVTARKIYRDDNDGNWLLLGTVNDNTTTTYTDNLATGTSSIPTDNGLPPKFTAICVHLDRMWVSNGTSTLSFSSAGKPNTFVSTGYLTTNPKDYIVTQISFLGNVLVFNRRSMGWVLGSTSDTFRYEDIPGSVGCVDPRTIQVVMRDGVSRVIFASDRGLYEFNGSSLTYLSEDLEDQFSLNIQQALVSKGKHTDDLTTDFTAGTSSAGIAISGGTVSQANPKKTWQSAADWNGGSSLVNCVIDGAANTVSAVPRFAPSIGSGSVSSGYISGSNLDAGTAWGNPRAGTSFTENTGWVSSSFAPPFSGTITSVTIPAGSSHWTGGPTPGNPGTPVYVQVNLGGTVLYQTTIGTVVGTSTFSWGNVTVHPNVSLTGGTRYDIYIGTGSSVCPVSPIEYSTSPYKTSETSDGVFGKYLYMSVGFSSASASWTSPTYDTVVTSTLSASVSQSSSLGSGSTSSTVAESSSDGSTWAVSHTSSNLNGTDTFALSGYRYWRVRTTLTSTGATATAAAPVLNFAPAVWISAAIDTTTDITALNSLTESSVTPSGTSAAIALATSADNITYSSYTAIGSATPARYLKVRITLTPDSASANVPSVLPASLSWTVVSTFTSAVIDTGLAPSAWELFNTTQALAGTCTYQIRSASTSGGISGASYSSVTPGSFIPVTPNEFVQYKATLTSTADSVASIDTVEVNWYTSSGTTIRAASVWDGRRYYMAAAEYGQTVNNILFKYETDGTFKVFRSLSPKCFFKFFGDIYYGTSAKIIKWLSSDTDSGSDIAMDVQTAAINYGDQEHNKILRKVYLVGKNTGATYTVQFSTDMGASWSTLVYPETGATSFTTTTDNTPFKVRLQPNFSSGNATGSTHIIRILSNDAYPCEIRQVKAEAWIRQGEPR